MYPKRHPNVAEVSIHHIEHIRKRISDQLNRFSASDRLGRGMIPVGIKRPECLNTCLGLDVSRTMELGECGTQAVHMAYLKCGLPFARGIRLREKQRRRRNFTQTSILSPEERTTLNFRVDAFFLDLPTGLPPQLPAGSPTLFSSSISRLDSRQTSLKRSINTSKCPSI
ncbi:uncharacterized protein LOC143218487 isoform X1 [Lasioglossum baleicum]|uniref:uncharacterized protein LOC143218487 isoform X1 n=1 Tax=Lasioglossum baleicum TaxID=434251 RepID=UPI003FCD36A3